MIYGLGEKNKKYHMVWREMNNVYILKCYNYYYPDVYNRWYNTTRGLKKITLGKQKKVFDLINFFLVSQVHKSF